MSIKLNIGAACTIINDKYDSGSASISLEVELDATVLMETVKLHEHSCHLFELVRQALIDELNTSCHSEGIQRTADMSPMVS